MYPTNHVLTEVSRIEIVDKCGETTTIPETHSRTLTVGHTVTTIVNSSGIIPQP